MRKKINIFTFCFLLLLVLSFNLSICSADSKSSDLIKNIEWEKANFERGKKIFFENCAYCHSEKGDGKNWIGSFILPHPRDFTDPNIMKHIDRKRMFDSILNGRPKTAMPTWDGLLSIDEIRDVIVFIEKKFVKRY